MSSAETIRQPAVSGTFYPGTAAALGREIKAHLAEATAVEPGGTILAALVPHAGYRYSAAVAAPVYKALEGKEFDTVVIIGHDAHARGVTAILSDADAFETPLGRVAVDTAMIQALREDSPGIVVHQGVHSREHTVEVQLPFLQTVLPKARIVPVLFGEPTLARCQAFAQALARTAGDRRLLVLASSDLTHYPASETSRRTDAQTLALVKGLDVPSLFAHLEKAKQEGADAGIQTAMCACGGVGTAMLYAQALGGTRVEILKAANSGDVPEGDRDRVVGYGAALFIRPESAPPPIAAGAAEKPEPEFALPSEAQQELLRLARNRIREAQAETAFDYAPPASLREWLDRPAAVFVTLHRHGRLRGCIGMTQARAPLWRAVYDMAFSAAFSDPRFPPLTSAELADTAIEISVLSPLRQVPSADAIQPHKHGVVVRRGGQSGLFLPQVWEQIPEKDRFLGILCSEKAGLPSQAWKQANTELLVFTVLKFAEAEAP